MDVVALQLLVFTGSFVIALMIALRMFALWWRTRELPELVVGLSFFLCGVVGYGCAAAISFLLIRGAEMWLMKPLVVFSITMTCAGSLCYGLGTAQIFRQGARWPRRVIGATALLMLVGIAGVIAVPLEDVGLPYWTAHQLGGLFYYWGAAESFAMTRMLHRRAKIGLVEPGTVNWSFQWGVCALGIGLTFSNTLLADLLYAPQLPPLWFTLFASLIGFVTVTTLWLGFFPPQRLQARLARAYGV